MTMDREYIERQRAIVDACNSLELYPSEYAKLEDALNRIPTADVVEIRSGRWIGIDSLFWKPTHSGDIPVFRKTYRCSECRRRTAIAENYCPHCGCKMDKEDCNG